MHVLGGETETEQCRLHPQRLVLLPGAAEAVARLNRLGTVILVTNQSGIGRGYYTEAQFQAFQARLLADLEAAASNYFEKKGRRVSLEWTMLDGVDALVVPADLATALAAFPTARDHFDAFPPSARRGILEWIGQAKRAETRAQRIEETARLAAENTRANQWPRR